MDRDVSQHYTGIVSKLFDDSRAKFIDEMTRGLDHAYYLANVNLCNGIENRILPPVYQMTDADYYILGEEYRSQITEYVFRGYLPYHSTAPVLPLGYVGDGNRSLKVNECVTAFIFYICNNTNSIYYKYMEHKLVRCLHHRDAPAYTIKIDAKSKVISFTNNYPITLEYINILDLYVERASDTQVTYIETNLKERKVLTINKGSSCTHDFNNTKLFKHIDQVVELLNTYYTTNRHQLNPTFANVQLLREIEKKQQALTLQTKQAQDAAEESKRALQELADKQQEIIRINAEAQESADITAQINQDTLIKIERDSAVLSEKLAAYNALSSTDAIVDKMKTLVAGTNLVFSDLGNTITECAQHIPALTSINEDLAQKLSEKIAAFNTMRREIVETQRLLYKQSSAAFNMHQIDICPVVVACPINSEIMPPGSIYETGSNSIKRRVK
jgi:hypothetical protein